MLLHHKVSRGSTVMHLANFVNFAGELENALRGGGLARVHVGENSDIAILAEVGHDRFGWLGLGPVRRVFRLCPLRAKLDDQTSTRHEEHPGHRN